MALKLFRPYVSWQARLNALKVLMGTQLAEGPMVKQFEHEFSKAYEFDRVLAVNSGTSALELAYELAGIEAGDEVITPVLTCTATNLPLVRRGAKLVFADIDYDLNINIRDVENKITSKTKAIVFVHFGGNNRGLRQLLDLAGRYGIRVIEDAAQAVGSDFWGHADFTAVSLQAIKTLTAGDGGVLICKDQEDHQKAKRLRWFGYDREAKQAFGDTDLTEAGYKFHMNDISAAIGLGNLPFVDRLMSHKALLADVYERYGLFAHAWLAGGFTTDYEAMKEKYAREGIEIGQHHFRNDKYSIFKEFKTHCPVMDELEHSYFFVPYHHGVQLKDAVKIGGLAHDLLLQR